MAKKYIYINYGNNRKIAGKLAKKYGKLANFGGNMLIHTHKQQQYKLATGY